MTPHREPPDYASVPLYDLETERTAEIAYHRALSRTPTNAAAVTLCAARIAAIDVELRRRGVDPERSESVSRS